MLRVPVITWYRKRYGNELGNELGYVEFSNGCIEVARPSRTKYNQGDVVLITEAHCQPCIGVVLGIIDVDRGDLRTDARGMVSFDVIRPATMKDIKKYDTEDNCGIMPYLVK